MPALSNKSDEKRPFLHNEKDLETAEQTLHDWASALANEGRDRDAAEALRVASAILAFRCDFLFHEKSP